MGIFSKREKNTYTTFYIQGLPNVEINSICKLSFDEKFLIINSLKVKGFIKSSVKITNTFKIDNNKIISFDIVDKNNLETKKKSVIGRGIAGELIFGPLGAIIGGMSALGNTVKSTTEYFLNIAYYGKDKDDLKTIIFRVGESPKFARLFIQEYNNRFLIDELNLIENQEIFL